MTGYRLSLQNSWSTLRVDMPESCKQETDGMKELQLTLDFRIFQKSVWLARVLRVRGSPGSLANASMREAALLLQPQRFLRQ